MAKESVSLTSFQVMESSDSLSGEEPWSLQPGSLLSKEWCYLTFKRKVALLLRPLRTLHH